MLPSKSVQHTKTGKTTQTERLNHAIETMMTLDKEAYPYLYRVMNGGNSTMGAKLVYLLSAMRDQLDQQDQWAVYVAKNGSVYHALSIRYLVSIRGGSNATWQNMRAFACDAGLFNRIKPGSKSKVRQFQISDELGRRYGKTRGVGWYCIPDYTPELLQSAEQVARRYLKKGMKPSKISKKMIADVQGQARANQLYADGRKKGNLHKRIEHELAHRITSTIETKGYTTKADVVTMATASGYDQRAVEKVWNEYGSAIVKGCGAVYHRPSAAEKKLFSLTDNRWIISIGTE